MPEEEVIVDEMTLDDLPEVIVIEKLSFSDPWPYALFLKDLESEGTITLVARIGQAVAGFAICMTVLDELHLTNIAIHPDFRRKKVGHRLMERLFYVGQTQEYKMMYLDVRKSNLPAISFYYTYGFSTLYERKGYYRNPPEDALVMALDLDERSNSGVV